MANIEALRNLRRVVENAPEDLFHMRAVVEEAPCGTARCAFGWALIDPWFLTNTPIADLVTTSANSAGRLFMNFHGAAKLFGISAGDTNDLFADPLDNSTDAHAVTREEVLWNINELLSGRDALPYEATGDSSAPMFAMNIENDSYFEDIEDSYEDEEEVTPGDVYLDDPEPRTF